MDQDRKKIIIQYICAGLGFLIGGMIFFFSGKNIFLIFLAMMFLVGAFQPLAKAARLHKAYLSRRNWLIGEVQLLLKDRDRAIDWITRPKRALNGETPWDYAARCASSSNFLASSLT